MTYSGLQFRRNLYSFTFLWHCLLWWTKNNWKTRMGETNKLYCICRRNSDHCPLNAHPFSLTLRTFLVDLGRANSTIETIRTKPLNITLLCCVPIYGQMKLKLSSRSSQLSFCLLFFQNYINDQSLEAILALSLVFSKCLLLNIMRLLQFSNRLCL